MSRIIKASTLALLAASAVSGAAQAGGFDRGGVNIDLLFSEERVTSEVTGTYVMPQRTIENVQRGANEAVPVAVLGTLINNAADFGFNPTVDPESAVPPALQVQAQAQQFLAARPAVAQSIAVGVAANPTFAPATSASIDVESDFFVPRVGLKIGLTDDASCLATYTEPFGADAEFGTGNAYSASTVAFSIGTRDYGLTCSYRFAGPELGIGKSHFRIIGGVSYQELEGFQSRQRFLDLVPVGGAGGVSNPLGIGQFSVDGDSVGWRIGAAFEVPDIALRAQVVYNSAYKYDLSGFQDNSDFFDMPIGTALVPITASTEIPQSVEIKLQSGIAEGTLAFVNIKWQEWSKLQSIAINGGISPVTGDGTDLSFDPFYQDGWTVTAGLGRQFTDALAGQASLTWDRGTSTITGSQTDTWTIASGVAFTPNENFELRFGGAVGVLTSGTSVAPPSDDTASNVSYSFGNDIVTAISGGLKVKF